MSELDPFFAPRSIAVVGASNRPSAVGHALLKNLLDFPGEVHAVNHKGGEILGKQAVTSLSEIEGDLDLVVVAIPPKYIPGVIDEAGAKGVKATIVISAGFAEIGAEGQALSDQMIEKAKGHGMRIVGPNCLGILRPSAGMNASFSAGTTRPGPVGLLSQSGALITGIITYAEQEQFGLSAAVSLGAKADVADAEVLRWLADDARTRAIAIYVEAFPDPHAFFEVAREVAKTTPIVALKGGATDAGAKAASSHTGSLAGSNVAYRAAFAQAGVLQASSIGDFMAWSRALAYQPVARGNRLAIVTNAGGPGVLCADEASRHGVELATLSADTKAALDQVLPSVWSHNNPVDVIGDAGPERFREALEIVARAPEVDGVVVIMTVQAMTHPLETARAIAEGANSTDKPILASFLGLAGTEVGSFLDQQGIPEFNTPERAVSAMGALMRRGAWLARTTPPGRVFVNMPKPDHAAARAAIDEARGIGQTNLDLGHATAVLKAAGLRYNKSGTADDEDGAVALATEIGFPVVIKVVSPDVLHKSDVGGVVLNVIDADGVRDACAKIRRAIGEHQPGARIRGFTIEEQVTGTEVIVGMSRDPGFGPMLMVGMGGVFVEVYKDVAFRLIPFERADALEAIGEIRAQALLNGARGRPVLDRDELAEVLLRVSALVEATPEIEELDINPLVITPDRGLVCIDARVIVSRK